MKRMALQIWVVFFLLQPRRGIRALLIARRYITRDWFSFGFRLGAFDDDKIAGHECYSFGSETVSSSSVSPGSSSVKPKREVTGTRARDTLPNFSTAD